jgi:hypothetical protein
MDDSGLLLYFFIGHLKFLVEGFSQHIQPISFMCGLVVFEFIFDSLDLILHHSAVIGVYLPLFFKLGGHVFVSFAFFTGFFLLDLAVFLGQLR